MADLRVKGEYVGPGERKTAEFLADRLPDHWVIFAGRKLPGPNRDDVDLIVVGTSLIFILEEKAWGPTVVVDDNHWYVGDDRRPNPLNRSAQIARILASTLRERAKGFQTLTGGHRVHAAVVMSHDRLQLLCGRNHESSERIWPLMDAQSRLEELDGGFRGGNLGVTRSSIIAYLDDLPAPAGKPKLGGYTLKTRLPGAGEEQAWEATDSTGSPVTLKCYPAGSMADLGDPQAFLRREFEAINRAHGLGRTWQAYPPFYDDSGQLYVVPVVPPRGGTHLQSSVQQGIVPARVNGVPDDETARAVTDDAFRALFDIHEAGLVHRALHPSRVWLHQKLKVMFSDFHLARITDEKSIALWVDDGDISEQYRAPECAVSVTLATPSSDIYSLSLCLIYWLLGEDAGNPATDGAAAKLMGTFPWAQPLLDALSPDPSARPLARQMVELLTVPPPHDDQQAEPTPIGVFEENALIANRYRILRKLGRGGSATSWKVYDTNLEMPMVLKEFHGEVPDAVRAEFNHALHLHNDYCGSVYDLQRDQIPSYLVSEYVRGENLTRTQTPHTVTQLRNIAVCVLKALDYIHGRNLVHGDVTPFNIIATPDGNTAKLIDFGLMVRAGDHPRGVTPKFAAPEVERGKPATVASDLYGFGASMVFAMLGRPVRSNVAESAHPPTKDEELAWGVEGTHLLNAFLQAVQERPEDRPASAAQLLELVRSTGSPVPTPHSQQHLALQINPNVASIRRLYRASTAGNAGNRGLDDAFAVTTYVPTLLDKNLLPRILEGELDLVLLSGNPGDGKTSLLVQLGERLKKEGAEVVHEDAAGWHMTKDSRNFHAVFDASESNGDLTSDELVKQALEPVRTRSNGPATAIIAVNDGRLHQFFDDHSHLYEQWWFDIQDQMEGKTSASSRVALIDLKRRSLAATDLSGLASHALAALTREDLWTACEFCAAQAVCPILANRNNLAYSGAEAFAELMLISHLRRRRRSTFRDVRSAAAWLITGNCDCQDAHQLLSEGRNAALMTRALCHDLAFDDASNDYLVREWSDLDPAAVPDPSVDRARRQSSRTGALLPTVESAARSVYFGQLLDNGLTRDAVRAYRYLPEFLAMLCGEDPRNTRDRLLLGISRLVGAPGFVTPGLAFGVGARDTGWAVLHTITADEFDLHVADTGHPYVETIADILTLKHPAARLELTLDTAEIILRAADGELVNDPASDAIRQEIDAFVGQLSRHPSRSAEIVDSSGSVTKATVHGQNITFAVDRSGTT